MKSLQEDLYSGALGLWGMVAQDSGSHRSAENLYRFDNEYGSGEYRVYFCGNLFAVNSYEMRFARKGVMRYQHTEHLSIVNYEEVRLFSQTGGAIASGTIDSYIAEEGAEYLARFEAGGCVRATSITISPDYYRDYLQKRFGDIPDVRQSFAAIAGRRDVPKLAALFRRVRDYRGEGMAAQLFYEGAVAEAVGLVMGKAEALRAEEEAGGRGISAEDCAAIEALDGYMRSHLDGDLSTAELARIACMGQTKFKRVFHRVLGAAPRDYVASLRMERAEQLLRTTSMPVSRVAAEVGYRKPGAFTDAFRRHAGAAPSALRKDFRAL